jgi:isopropylmalate/isohomocitrate dehydrogenase-like protein
MKKICVLPGDGIGPEVVECAVRVMASVTDQLEFVTAPIGLEAFEKTGSYFPDSTLELMMSCDSSLFGAVTSSDSPDYKSPVLTFRKALDLYANIRPVRSLVRLRDRPKVDIIIVRENSEGMYTQNEVYDDEGVTTLRRVTKRASTRIIGHAIELARAEGRKRICCVHKSNVLRASDGLFVNIFRELMAERGGDLKAETALVDSAALRLVVDPSSFDVIVTMNLYGDILSDVAAGVAGGLGFAPSANVGPKHSVFEPAHGSAPDIAGKGIANPSAAILAGAMMMRHVGLVKEASLIERSLEATYSDGHLTADIGGRHGSKSFTSAVIDRISRASR